MSKRYIIYHNKLKDITQQLYYSKDNTDYVDPSKNLSNILFLVKTTLSFENVRIKIITKDTLNSTSVYVLVMI